MRDFSLLDEARDLLASWYGAREEGRLPPKAFVDPIKLRRWLSDISVLHLHEGEKRFYVALHGANVARHLGPDFNRHYLEDVVPDVAKPDAFAPYELSLETGLPSYSIQQQTLQNGLFKTLERMVMPCGDGAPTRPERFLVWAAPVKASTLTSTSVYAPFEEGEMTRAAQDAPDRTATVVTLSPDWLETPG